MKEYLKIIDEIIALVGLHLIPKFVNLYQGQVDIRCEENDTGVLINIIVSLPDKNELQALQNQVQSIATLNSVFSICSSNTETSLLSQIRFNSSCLFSVSKD